MNEINLKERVKAICDEKGFKFNELAAMMGVDKSTVSRVLSGNPTLSKLVEIANALDVLLSELFSTGQEVAVRCPKCGEKIVLDIEVKVK